MPSYLPAFLSSCLPFFLLVPGLYLASNDLFYWANSRKAFCHHALFLFLTALFYKVSLNSAITVSKLYDVITEKCPSLKPNLEFLNKKEWNVFEHSRASDIRRISIEIRRLRQIEADLHTCYLCTHCVGCSLQFHWGLTSVGSRAVCCSHSTLLNKHPIKWLVNGCLVS